MTLVDVTDDRATGKITLKTARGKISFTGPNADVVRAARECCGKDADPAAAFWLGVATVLSLVNHRSREGKQNGKAEENQQPQA